MWAGTREKDSFLLTWWSIFQNLLLYFTVFCQTWHLFTSNNNETLTREQACLRTKAYAGHCTSAPHPKTANQKSPACWHHFFLSSFLFNVKNILKCACVCESCTSCFDGASSTRVQSHVWFLTCVSSALPPLTCFGSLHIHVSCCGACVCISKRSLTTPKAFLKG